MWHRGGIPVLFDFTSSDDEIRYILNEAQPEIIFCSLKYETAVRAISSSLVSHPTIHVFENLPGPHHPVSLDSVSWNDIDDTALMMYTSGTTGMPKGAMLSFRNLMSNIRSVLEFATPHDSILLLLPLYHIFPLLWTVIAPMYAGVCTVFSPSLDPGEVLAVLQHARVTAIVGVPALFERIHKSIFDKIQGSLQAKAAFRLCQTIGSISLSRLLFRRVHAQFGGRVKYLICGGAALDIAIQKDFMTLGFPIYTGYGLTETSPMISFNKPGFLKLGSIGLPIPAVTVEIRNDEIVVQGDNVMQGYFHHPEETQLIIRDNWLYTGDTGYIDQEGFLFFTGRKKEIIVLPNGKNIDPLSVEHSLSSFTRSVREAGVYERHGRLAAIIVSKNGLEIENESIHHEIKWNVIDVYNRTVPSYKKIYSWTLTDAPLPKTSLGKLKRYALSSFAEQHANKKGSAAFISSDTSPLLRYIQKEKKINASPDDNLVLDLGMDSLDMVLFLSYIESEYGLVITAEDVLRQQTVGALSEYIQHYLDSKQSGNLDWQTMFDETETVAIPKTWWTIALWQFLVRSAYQIWLNASIRGMETIPPGPVLFVANHQSSLDQYLVTSFFSYRQFRKIYYLAKEFHYRAAWKQWLVDRHNVVLVHPTETLLLALRKLARCLQQGGSVLIFPEGTRSSDGSLSDFKKSFALLSCALGVPVVPVIIDGTIDALPKGTLFPRRGVSVSVRFLQPVHPDGHTPASLTAEIFSIIKSAVEKNHMNQP
ncbi:MAG: long-chain fatty acid--CoA ligase [Ignavibacteriae bacterium]|nr:MAG: long-chain fatty acid--CoA ligase [Ignavibacteriota bacterium]